METSITQKFRYSHLIFKDYQSQQTINTKICIDFLKKLLRVNPGKIVKVIWDNARVHTAKKIKSFL